MHRCKLNGCDNLVNSSDTLCPRCRQDVKLYNALNTYMLVSGSLCLLNTYYGVKGRDHLAERLHEGDRLLRMKGDR